MVSFPYYSHTTPIRIPKDMGIVWEAYHKGVPLLGVPGITLDCMSADLKNTNILQLFARLIKTAQKRSRGLCSCANGALEIRKGALSLSLWGPKNDHGS